MQKKINKKNKRRVIELLAPAKNLECGIAAINHGADAVYIGAPKFGARAAAGNTIEDLSELVEHAHLYNARVYVTLNTILKDDELPETESLIWSLYRIGVDALIVQDMALTMLNLPPIPLHASTQMNNCDAAKVKFLQEVGFSQTVLARELSLYEIETIHDEVPEMPLEVFVHGALCVSYSGQCYVSEACFNRSANRGECAQFCRLPFSLIDATGEEIVRDKHLLSLKDMNRIEHLEQMLDAGVSSFKIEGRLKDVSYVKNVTASYRQALDAILKRRNEEFVRSSSGKTTYHFVPSLEKSFNRGFTSYLLHGKQEEIFSFDTPKSLGEEVGVFKEAGHNFIIIASLKSFSNGDGLCYIDEAGKLKGFRVNRVEGNKIFPQTMPRLKRRTKIYRNNDQDFIKKLSGDSAERKIEVDIDLYESQHGFTLSLTDCDGTHVALALDTPKELAAKPQLKNITTQLSKLGNTPFVLNELNIDFSKEWFIPASQLTQLRRDAFDKLLQARKINYRRELRVIEPSSVAYPEDKLTYLANVYNEQAVSFYKQHGVSELAYAYERKHLDNVPLMFCKHCLKYSMGWCTKTGKKSPYKEPFYLKSNDGKTFQLEFDCKRCIMKVYLK